MATADQTRRGRVAEFAAATLLFGVATWFLTSPLFDDPSGSLLSTRSITTWLLTSNTDLFIWVLAWDWHALTTQPWAFWDANILHPTENSLAAVFPRLGHLPVFGPIYAFTGNPVAAHQWNMLANYALSGAALYILLRHWGVRPLAALAGGFIYALCPARINGAATPSLVAGQYLPLGLLFLQRTAESSGWRNPALAALFLVWQAACSLVHVFLVPLVAFTWAIYCGLNAATRRRAMLLFAIAAVTTLFAALMIAPMVAAVVQGRLEAPPGLGPDAYYHLGSVRSLADLLNRGIFFHGGGDATRVATPLYLGWTTLGAALLAGLLRSGGAARVWGGAALLTGAGIATALALGPRGPLLTAPWTLMAKAAPGAVTLLMPSHFGFFLVLVAAVFAATGVDRAVHRLRWPVARRVAAVLVIALVAWEFRLLRGEHGLQTMPRSPFPPRVYSLLEDRPSGAVLEVPIDTCRIDSNIAKARAMFDSTFHWRPLLNGLGELPPTQRTEMNALVSALPDRRALHLLARIADLRHVVLHATAMPVAERYAWMDVAELREAGFADGRLLLEFDGAPGPSLTERFRSLDQQSTTLQDTPVAALPESARVVEAQVFLGVAASSPRLPMRAQATVTNASDRPWPVLGGRRDQRVELLHYWEDVGGNLLGEVERTPLPFDLVPGESVSFPFCTSPPAAQGTVFLRATVAQGEARFRGEPARAELELRPFQRVDPE